MTDSRFVDPAVYPHHLGSIYPSCGSVTPISSSVYPTVAICEFSCAIADFETERHADPAAHKRTAEPTRSSAPRTVSSKLVSGVNISLDVCYPHFNLCRYSTWTELRFTHFVSDPAVYPHNLRRVYLIVEHETVVETTVDAHTGGLEFVSCIYTCPCKLHLPVAHALG